MEVSLRKTDTQTRLQKILADAGICSRREAEKLIQEGLVTINGKSAKLGDKASLETDHVKVRGKLITRTPKKVYIALFKPRGVVSCDAPLGENQNQIAGTIWQHLQKVSGKIKPVGTLDSDAEGLLLITNDGDLRSKLLNSKAKIPRSYSVKIDGHLEPKKIRRLEKGVWVEEHKIRVAELEPTRESDGKQWVKVTLNHPQNRIVRKLFESVGHPVDKLRRDSIGNIGLKGLERGQYRFLTAQEVDSLRKSAELPEIPAHERVVATVSTKPSRKSFTKDLDSFSILKRSVRRTLKKHHKSTKEW
jgi:23S rRNA pseudouridine2605 synthase